MNRILTTVLLALSLPLAAHADEASHRTKAQALITLMRTQEMLSHNAENLKAQVASVASNTVGFDPTPQKKADAEAFLKQANQAIDAKLGWPSIEAAITDIYVKNFTEDQLDAILAFYKSPAGAALMANMPTANTQIQALGNQRLNVELKPQLLDLVTSFKEKETPAAPKATTAPSSPAAAAPPTPAPAK